MADDRVKQTIEIWTRCKCGKPLHSIQEATRGECSSCWFAAMPADTKQAMADLIKAAFRPTTKEERNQLVDDALLKLKRDQKP